MYDALLARRLPSALTAAIINEFTNLPATPMFQNIDFEESMSSKSIKQGGVEGPWCWNQIMAWLPSMLASAWIQAGCGVWLGHDSDDSGFMLLFHRPPVATHAAWSDNIFIFA